LVRPGLWVALRKAVVGGHRLARIPRAKRLVLVPLVLPLGLNQVKRILPASECHKRGIIAESRGTDNGRIDPARANCLVSYKVAQASPCLQRLQAGKTPRTKAPTLTLFVHMYKGCTRDAHGTIPLPVPGAQEGGETGVPTGSGRSRQARGNVPHQPTAAEVSKYDPSCPAGGSGLYCLPGHSYSRRAWSPC
jgi:hypothetical protein